jgi:hypothetical protein
MNGSQIIRISNIWTGIVFMIVEIYEMEVIFKLHWHQHTQFYIKYPLPHPTTTPIITPWDYYIILALE